MFIINHATIMMYRIQSLGVCMINQADISIKHSHCMSLGHRCTLRQHLPIRMQQIRSIQYYNAPIIVWQPYISSRWAKLYYCFHVINTFCLCSTLTHISAINGCPVVNILFIGQIRNSAFRCCTHHAPILSGYHRCVYAIHLFLHGLK